MNGSHDISFTPPVGGDDDRFDPSDAAELLVSARRKALRGFEQRTPLGYPGSTTTPPPCAASSTASNEAGSDLSRPRRERRPRT